MCIIAEHCSVDIAFMHHSPALKYFLDIRLQLPGRDIFLVRGVIAIPKMFRRCKKLKLEVFTQFQLTSLLIKDSPGKKMVAG